MGRAFDVRQMHDVIRDKAYDLQVELVSLCRDDQQHHFGRELTIEILNRLYEFSVLEVEEDEAEAAFGHQWPDNEYELKVRHFQDWLRKAHKTCKKLDRH